ncbi:MAG: bifunctional tRNA (5-methylaminomethyl-2-thiouridine)(34)-methyltransferase MnmD/FAD-dependent 5-carboxymethylaminomethyl-2-thiouridine(34) oxidoreductase MnmC [Pseudomonadota bacterium]
MSPGSAPITPARLDASADGTPFSAAYGDVYFSRDGGVAETRQVFLAGNGLPERWRGRSRFVVVETGFGTGLNFLATWQAWRADPAAPRRLHYFSVEAHPLARDDLAAALAPWRELAELPRALTAAYPPLVPGFHRRHFDGGRVTLTLALGEAEVMLGALEAGADAFYLDGFAPARNPAMWSERVFGQLARLAAPGATLATYTVAGEVRARAAAAGFRLEKRAGFGRKREMLAGVFSGRGGTPAAAPVRVAVIGAGLAGTACAERLAARGVAVDLIERHAGPAREASANPCGVLRPMVSAAWTPQSRFTAAAAAYGTHELTRGGEPLRWGASGVLQLSRGERHAGKIAADTARMAAPADFVRGVDQAEAAAIAGVPVSGPGVWFAGGAWAVAPSVCEARLARAGEGVRRVYSREAVQLRPQSDGWQVADAAGAVICAADAVILANAWQVTGLPAAAWLPVRPVRGQTTLIPARAPAPQVPVCREGCITPAVDGWHALGATFGEEDPERTPRAADNLENLGRLERMLPGYGAGLDPQRLDAWVGFRAVSADRFPLAGALARNAGEPPLYACLALGARGLAWSGLAAELVASLVCGDPLPLERDVLAALDPARYRSGPENP